MVSLADQALQEKTDSPAVLDSQVYIIVKIFHFTIFFTSPLLTFRLQVVPDNQANQAKMVLTEDQELLVALVSRDLLDLKVNQVRQDSQAALVVQDLLGRLAFRDLKANQANQDSLAAQAQLDLLEDQDHKEAPVLLDGQEHLADQDLQDLLVQLELPEV
jgi:hypothetical protein